jgi:hypothetical protein
MNEIASFKPSPDELYGQRAVDLRDRIIARVYYGRTKTIERAEKLARRIGVGTTAPPPNPADFDVAGLPAAAWVAERKMGSVLLHWRHYRASWFLWLPIRLPDGRPSFTLHPIPQSLFSKSVQGGAELLAALRAGKVEAYGKNMPGYHHGKIPKEDWSFGTISVHDQDGGGEELFIMGGNRWHRIQILQTDLVGAWPDHTPAAPVPVKPVVPTMPPELARAILSAARVRKAILKAAWEIWHGPWARGLDVEGGRNPEVFSKMQEAGFKGRMPDRETFRTAFLIYDDILPE